LVVVSSRGIVLSKKVSLAAIVVDVAKIQEIDMTVIRGSREISTLKKDSIAQNIHICD
jgi:hypothetical protein